MRILYAESMVSECGSRTLILMYPCTAYRVSKSVKSNVATATGRETFRELLLACTGLVAATGV
jgi:hypothetical protein